MLTLESVITKPVLHSTFIDFCMVLAKMSHDALQSAGTDSSTDSSWEDLMVASRSTSAREPAKLETPSLKPPFNLNQLIESSHSLKCVLLTFSIKHHISALKLTQLSESTCKLLH